jgi:hypothetical protein
MKWVTRAGIHIDRSASAWLIRRFLDPDATFEFVSGPDELPEDGVPFDMRGVEFGHHGTDCTFETLLRKHEVADPVLWRIAAIIHEADLDDELYDAPEAPGLDTALRGLSMVTDDHTILELTGPLFDGLYEFFRRALMTGTEPA